MMGNSRKIAMVKALFIVTLSLRIKEILGIYLKKAPQ
jgi:hypothetical protein